MKKNVIDLGSIEFKNVIKEVQVAGKAFEVSVTISVQNSHLFMENICKGKTHREAFCKFALEMHSEAQNKKPSASTRRIFNAMSDDEALAIMQIVVNTNTDAPHELWKQEIQDIYDRFEVYIREYCFFETKQMVGVFNTLVATMMKQIASNWTNGLFELSDSLSDISSNMMSAMKASLAELKETTVKYFNSRVELDPVMSEFGWGGLSVIPGNIIQYVNAEKSNMSTDDVDNLIISYFKNRDYKELDLLVSSWRSNPYFANRKLAIEEALNCFKLNLNIASLTLLTLHIDGIVKEFLFFEFGIKLLKNEKAIEKISNLAIKSKDGSNSYFYDCNVKAVNEIRKRLTEPFEIEKIDETSNLSRHKIAHGHMYDDVSSDIVLKTFLWMNELENLLSTILKNKNNSQSKD